MNQVPIGFEKFKKIIIIYSPNLQIVIASMNAFRNFWTRNRPNPL